MKITRTDSFKKDFRHLPKHARKTFEKKIKLLIENPSHPSLRVKKMKGHEDIWECSITMFYRFTFQWHNDEIILRRIGPHDDVLINP